MPSISNQPLSVMMNHNFLMSAHRSTTTGGQRQPSILMPYSSARQNTFRNLVRQCLHVYIDSAVSQNEKSRLVDMVTRELLDMNMTFAMRVTARTTNDDDSTTINVWEKMTFEEARAKVARRFRDAVRRLHMRTSRQRRRVVLTASARNSDGDEHGDDSCHAAAAA